MDLQSQTRILLPPHPLTNFEIQKSYQNESRSNGVYSRDNLLKRSPSKIKDGTYVIKNTYKIMMLLILIVLE